MTIVATDKENDLSKIDNLFAVNKKCKVELGIVNTVPNYTYSLKDKDDFLNFIEIDYKKKYGNIIWFPLGLYIMFNPSIAHGTDGVTISMQLKDKMCLLNGDIGGVIHSGVDFNYQDEVTDGSLYTVEKKETLVYNIIKQLVHHWGNEQLSKIIISEVPLKIKKVVKWTGNNSIYVYVNTINQIISQVPIDNAEEIESGYDVGFTYEDFTPPIELSCNPGETVASVLDKIIGFMGNYEYFYDVYGNFIFREKQNYLNMTNTAYWTKEQAQDKKICNLPTQVYQADHYRLSKAAYSFLDNIFNVNLSNSFNYNNIKNDFVVWGALKSVNNTTSPCRFHLAIDKKPDLNKHNIVFYKDDFNIVRGIANYWINTSSKKQIELDEDYSGSIQIGDKTYSVIAVDKTRQSTDWREEIYYQMLESEKLGTDTNTELNNSYFQYYAELKQEFPKIYDLSPGEGHTAMGWNDITINHPQQIAYYLDFIDENSGLGQYSVNNIGRRSKVIEDSNEGINCVFEPAIPDVVYIDTSKLTRQEWEKETSQLTDMGQIWTQIPSNIYDLFVTGGVLNSCFEKIKDLLYQYTHMNNNISFSTIPIYHLEPGSRVTLQDKQNGIEGDYIIQSISLPLDVSSTMSINAYKALQKI